MVWSQHLLPHHESALGQGPGGVQLTPGLEQPAEVADTLGGDWVIGSHRALPDGQGAFVEGLGGS